MADLTPLFSLLLNVILIASFGFIVLYNKPQSVDSLLLRINQLEQALQERDLKIAQLEEEQERKDELHKRQVNDLYEKLIAVTLQVNELSNGRVSPPGRVNEGNARYLRETIKKHFNEEEFLIILQDIGVDRAELKGGINYESIILEALEYIQRRQITPNLLRELKRARPGVSWPGIG